MKLEEIRVDRSFDGTQIHLGRFADGLNFVYGENAAGKSTVAQLVRQTLLGQPLPLASTNDLLSGRLSVRRNGFSLSLHRLPQRSHQLDVQLLDRHHVSPIVPTEHELTSAINHGVYDSVFNVSFKQTSRNAFRLGHVLHDYFQIPFGRVAAGDDAGYQRAQRERETWQSRVESIKAQLSQLTAERQRLIDQQEVNHGRLQKRLQEVEQLIADTQSRLNRLHHLQLNEQLSRVTAEIETLRLKIDNAQAEIVYPPIDPQHEHLASLYFRLDEIDTQIHRWRHVQADVQSQRLRLKDEMAIWSELTLESDDHPYHLAREILVGLETKVDLAERNAQHWASAGGARVDTDSMARSLGELCQSMRDDLYGLCHELSHQFKHLRHKAAAAELKNLRRCYNEMGENIERLVRRRSTVIREIRELDPAGADAIVRAENRFCQCAQHEGYLEARRRFVGPTTEMRKPVQVEPDLTVERARLAELELQRRDLSTQRSNHDLEISSINAKLTELERERDSIVAQLSAHSDSRISKIDAEVAELNRELLSLKDRLLQPLAAPVGHPLLQRAATLLNRITEGALTRVYLDLIAEGQHPSLCIDDRLGHVLSFDRLDNDRQDQVYLSLMLAAREYLQQHENLVLPTLIDDAFCHISGDRINPTLTVLQEFGQAGHQIVLLTQHRYLADRAPGVPVLTVEPVAATTSPARAISPQVIRRGEDDWARQNRFDDVCFESASPRPYPLSKYPRTPMGTASDTPKIYPLAFESTEPREFRHPHLDDQPLASAYSSVSVDSIGDPIDYLPAYNENTPLEQTGLLDPVNLRRLMDHRLFTIAELLRIDADTADQWGLSADLVERWQSQVWLMINVPNLRPDDARVLVACGIIEPQQLATSHPQQLEERIVRFLGTSSGRRGGFDNLVVSRDRIGSWIRALDSTRDRWQNRRRPQRSLRSFEPRQWEPASDEYSREAYRTRAFGSANRNESTRPPLQPRPPRMHSEPRPDSTREYVSRQNRAAATEAVESRSASAVPNSRSNSNQKPKTQRQTGKVNAAPVSGELKFYLDPEDHIEAAPSIGPKTAERFEKIGITTVAEFLRHTAESMATKLNYKRLNADLLRQWQHQARLVCRVPNLRGHDAQLLVGCDIIEPEELATMQPQKLMEKIGPFAESKEGQRIIRSGKQPDLEEITDWITWAGETRSLQAA